MRRLLFLCLTVSIIFQSIIATGISTPHAIVNCVFNSNASTIANHSISSNFPKIINRPAKLPTQICSPTTQSYSGWSAEQFANYFIRTSPEQSRIFIRDTSLCAPQVVQYTSDFFQLTPERQQEIFQRYDLYPCPGFIKYIQKLPDFPQFVTNLQTQLSNDAFYKHFNELANQFPQIKELYHDNRNNLARVITGWYEKLPQICDGDRLQQHLDNLALSRQPVIEACSNLKTVVDKSYVMNSGAQAVATKAGADLANYTTCTGTIVQQAIHSRCLQVLEESALLPKDSAFYKYQEKFGGYVEAARECNQAQQLHKANRILDFCFLALDCGKAAFEGIKEGLTAAVIDILEHPVQVGLCLIAGEYVLAYQASKVVYNLADIGLTYAFDPKQGLSKWNEYVAPIKRVVSAIYNNQVTLRDGIKGVTKFAVQWNVQGKIFGSLHGAYNGAKNKVAELAHKLPGIKSAPQLVTPEGILLKASNNSGGGGSKVSKITGSTVKEVIKVGNMKEFFEKTKFGQTIKDKIEKTKEIYQGQSVYRVKENMPDYGLAKGDQVYLDNLHKDHLEIFRKNGSFKTILNLDGTRNIDKADRAIGRRL